MKSSKILVQNTEVSIKQHHKVDFISLTDIARYKDRERSDYILQNWMRNRETIEFLGLWEKINNDNFNSIEFDGIKMQAGINSFILTPKRWIEKTSAIGIISKAGRYGGTYAHRDIAFEFASWISLVPHVIDKPKENFVYASVQQLIVLSNLESINAELLKQELPQNERLIRLNQAAISQIKSLIHNPTVEKLSGK